jgi:hypothetical protein
MIHKYFILLLLILLLNFLVVHSYGIGISPDKISFDTKEKSIFLLNPNNFDVNYSILGCDYQFLEFLRNGKISPKSKRVLLLRYNPALNNKTKNCSIDIIFSNPLYSTGFSVTLAFNNQNNNASSQTQAIYNIEDFLKESNSTKAVLQSKKINYTFISVISAVFVLLLVIVWRFV